jgi:hypothetical protein
MALPAPLLLLLLHITTARCIPHTLKHKVLTHKEYRAVSGVFRTIDPPPTPLSTQRVCPPPAPPKTGDTHSPGGEGVGRQYFGRRQTLDWPLIV